MGRKRKGTPRHLSETGVQALSFQIGAPLRTPAPLAHPLDHTIVEDDRPVLPVPAAKKKMLSHASRLIHYPSYLSRPSTAPVFSLRVKAQQITDRGVDLLSPSDSSVSSYSVMLSACRDSEHGASLRGTLTESQKEEVLAAPLAHGEFILSLDDLIRVGDSEGRERVEPVPANVMEALVELLCMPSSPLALRVMLLPPSRDEIQLRISFWEDSFYTDKSASELPARVPFSQKLFSRVLAWIFPSAQDFLTEKDSWEKDGEEFNPLLFYQLMAPSPDRPLLETPPPHLKATLRSYQSQAVRWMVEREQLPSSLRTNPSWQRVQTGAMTFYYDQFTGMLARKPPQYQDGVKGGILADEMGLGKTIEMLACILSHPHVDCEKQVEDYRQHLHAMTGERMSEDDADQEAQVKCYCRPGTHGRNSSVIQCHSCRTWQHQECVGMAGREDDVYQCPHCAFSAPAKRPSKTTLIICPAAIIQQWRHEIVRWTSLTSFRMAIYEGITETNRSNQLAERASSARKKSPLVLPCHLADYDIILTTYDTLRADLNHSFMRETGSRRGNRQVKYRSLPTPLTGLTWWRVCVDEAQMVSSGAAKASAMALQLDSVHRWCVSGTPIQRRGLDDLHGLLLFLQVPYLGDPYWFRRHFSVPMDYPQCRKEALAILASWCKPWMWRSSKEAVRDELGIPPQSERTHRLKFSPIESHFYKKQHQACSDASRRVLQRAKQNRLTAKQMSSLMNSLLRLRQACCHPQVGQHSTGIQIQRTPLTMDQLLEQLTLKAKIECEEAQRQWICAGSALAALDLVDALRKNEESFAADAARLYREMIKVCTENEPIFAVDAIQKLHLYHNLAAILGQIPQDPVTHFSQLVIKSTGHSLLDGELPAREAALREEYMKNSRNQYLTAKYANTQAKDHTHRLMQQVDESQPPWWRRAFQEDRLDAEEGEELVRRLHDVLMDVNGRLPGYRQHPQCLRYRFVSMAQLQLMLQAEIQSLHMQHDRLLEAIQNDTPSDDAAMLEEQVEELIACPCRHSGINNTDQYCHSCRVFKRIGDMEQLMYFDSTANNRQADGLARAKHDSDLFVLLQALPRFLSVFPPEEAASLTQEIRMELNILKSIRSELKPQRQLWEAHRNYFLSVDELHQATTRIRLRFPEEVVPETDVHYKIHAFEVDTLRQRFLGDKATAWTLLEQRKGQLKYLTNLAGCRKSDQPVSSSEDECVICREPMGDHVVILVCGHEFCGACITSLIVRSHGTLKCPTCRTRMNSDEIAFVSDTPIETIQESIPSDLPATEEAPAENAETSVSEEEESHDAITVAGSWGAKIEAVVRELIRIQRADSRAKTLIFSQWNQVLELIKQALTQNHIASVLLTSGNKKQQNAALHSFRFADSISVLLLPLKRGANGLNLTEATHVFLVEPLLNPGAEAQAIGRVDRIGQSHATVVHRFIVQNTVEEKIQWMNSQRQALQQDQCHRHSLSHDLPWRINKAEKDCMSTDDLYELFEIEQEETENGDSLAHREDDISLRPQRIRFAQPAAERFWNTLVRWEGEEVTRHQVALQLESELACQPPAARRVCNLYSMKLPHSIARKILQLPEASEAHEEGEDAVL